MVIQKKWDVRLWSRDMSKTLSHFRMFIQQPDLKMSSFIEKTPDRNKTCRKFPVKYGFAIKSQIN